MVKKDIDGVDIILECFHSYLQLMKFVLTILYIYSLQWN